MSDDEWQQIGVVPVDAGCLLIVDPCYLRDVLFEGNKQIEAWYQRAVVEGGRDHWPVTHQDRKGGQMDLGHFVSTGEGDGIYPVEARFAEDGRIAEVRIRFSYDEDDDA